MTLKRSGGLRRLYIRAFPSTSIHRRVRTAALRNGSSFQDWRKFPQREQRSEENSHGNRRVLSL